MRKCVGSGKSKLTDSILFNNGALQQHKFLSRDLSPLDTHPASQLGERLKITSQFFRVYKFMKDVCLYEHIHFMDC